MFFHRRTFSSRFFGQSHSLLVFALRILGTWSFSHSFFRYEMKWAHLFLPYILFFLTQLMYSRVHDFSTFPILEQWTTGKLRIQPPPERHKFPKNTDIPKYS